MGKQRKARGPRDRTKTLQICWCPKEEDFKTFYPNSAGGRMGGLWLYELAAKRLTLNFFKGTFTEDHPSILEELEQRGFDTKTLRITIDRKEPQP